MLCPQCNRQVSKSGYCPQGHLARPDWAEKIERAAQREMRPAAPPPPPPPSSPPSPGAPTVEGAPGLPPTAGPIRPPRRNKRVALALVPALALASLLGYAFIGRAGAADLSIKFISGETHRYRLEMTMRGKAGNLRGAFSADVSIGADLEQRTGAIEKDGTATLTYTLRNFTYSENGRRVTPPPGAGAAFTIKMRPDGTVVDLNGEDSFALDDVNPAGEFLSPANAGPLLPKGKIETGQSWKIETRQDIEDLGTLTIIAENRLLERKRIAGLDAVIIRSDVQVPLKFHIGHDELVKQAKKEGGSGDDIPGNAGLSMVGNMDMHLLQTVYSKTGLLQSGLGDGRMRGTMTFEGIPDVGNVPIAFDLQFNVTMIKLQTGQSA